jgi:glycerophosphoryl diester phosphodiesterase
MSSNEPQPLLLYGHRGASAERPENTLVSFERAVALGVDVLELDVHLTRDGHVVVSHDATGQRMASEPAHIRECSLAEVQRWDAGYGFVDRRGNRPFAGRGHRIPRLAEVLEAFRDVRLNIDIKQTDPPMVAPVLDLLTAQHALERTCLASLSTRTIRAVRAAGFRGPTVLARDEVLALLVLPRAAWRLVGLRGAAVQVPPGTVPSTSALAGSSRGATTSACASTIGRSTIPVRRSDCSPAAPTA